jgi:hypothetical protein
VSWHCIPLPLIACGAFVVTPIPHIGAFVRAHPVPSCVRTAVPCKMVWEPDSAGRLPYRIGGAPAAAPQDVAFVPGDFYWPALPVLPGGTTDLRSRPQPRGEVGVGGDETASAAPAQPVPEPSGLALLAVAMAALFCAKRRLTPSA